MLTLYIRTLLLKDNNTEIECSIIKDKGKWDKEGWMGREVGGKNKVGNRERTANSKGLLEKKVWKPTTVEAL